MRNIAVLASGGGTTLQNLMDRIEADGLDARIALVISDRRKAYALERARIKGIPTAYFNIKQYDGYDPFNHAILETLKEYRIDLVVLGGYLKILSAELIAAYKNRIINIHPSLIPSFCGMGFYGEHVHQAVLDYGVKLTGATVHLVDESADTGPIVAQKAVPVLEGDDVHTLQQRVMEAEREILYGAVKAFVEGRVRVEGRRVVVSD